MWSWSRSAARRSHADRVALFVCRSAVPRESGSLQSAKLGGENQELNPTSRQRLKKGELAVHHDYYTCLFASVYTYTCHMSIHLINWLIDRYMAHMSVMHGYALYIRYILLHGYGSQAPWVLDGVSDPEPQIENHRLGQVTCAVICRMVQWGIQHSSKLNQIEAYSLGIKVYYLIS